MAVEKHWEYSRIEIENFRSIRGRQRLDLEGLNVFVGPNGSGKTTILQIFDILGFGARGELRSYINNHGGISRLICKDSQAQSFNIKLVTNDSDFSDSIPLEYSVALTKELHDYTIQESLTKTHRNRPESPLKLVDFDSRRPLAKFFIPAINNSGASSLVDVDKDSYDPVELLLSEVDPRAHKDTLSLRSRIRRTAYTASRDFNGGGVAVAPQRVGYFKEDDSDDRKSQFLFPTPSGDNLLAVIEHIRQSYPEHHKRFMGFLIEGYPELVEITTRVVPDDKLQLVWREKSKDLDFQDLSDGTLRFIWLCAMFNSPLLPKVILLDEPELSLHPKLLELLAYLFKGAADRSQIFIATHADRLIRWLDKEDLVLVNKSQSGGSTFVRGNLSEDLAEWLKDYTLDQALHLSRIEGE